MLAKSSLHSLTHTVTERWLGSVTGCKPSSFSFISLAFPLPPSVLHHHPKVLWASDRDPWGPESCHTLTTNCWQSVPVVRTHSSPPLFPSSLCCHLSLLILSMFCFCFSLLNVSVSFSHPDSTTEQLIQSVLSSSLSPAMAAYTGGLNSSDHPWSCGGLRGAMMLCWRFHIFMACKTADVTFQYTVCSYFLFRRGLGLEHIQTQRAFFSCLFFLPIFDKNTIHWSLVNRSYVLKIASNRWNLQSSQL